MSRILHLHLSLVALLALGAGSVTFTGAAAAGPTGSIPDPSPSPEVARPEAGGQNEDANWLPLRGDHELWCTMSNPGYAGCAGHHDYPALDIGMPVGTEVYAAGPGTVRFAGSAGDARGTYVEIDHDDRIRSRYYHLSAELVDIGQQVERGTLIGRSGQSGRASSPHLHYEERTPGGDMKDPGVMYGVVDGRLLAYPNVSGQTSWWETPYGTRLRNQGFSADNTSLYWGGPGVATGDLNGDQVDDVVVGAPGEDTTDPGPGQGVTHIDSGAAFVLYGSVSDGPGVSAIGAERVLQEFNGVPGTMKSNEVFGAAVATGDFDGDGFDDLAVGAPAATVSGARAAGEVVVLHGSADGLIPEPRGLRLVGVSAESGDQFGAALATGDFDGDGFADLAVGAPGEGVGGRATAGAVSVFAGSATGLGDTPREITAALEAVAGDHESGDRLGVSLAAGDTNGDGIDDLAVGIPGEDTPDVGYPVSGDAGAVLVLRGQPASGGQGGLGGDDSVELHLDSPGVAGDGRSGDQLGMAVAVGDVQGDGFADVVVGAVDKDVGAAEDAGSVLVLRGSANGVRAGGSSHLTADSPDVAGAAQRGDHLGSGLALGDLDGDGAADLVVGIVGQAVGAEDGAGAVLVVPGGPDGLSGVGSRQHHSGSATTGLADEADADDVLGASVAVGDLDGNRFGDLVVGMPGADAPGAVDAGAIIVAYGRGRGVIPALSQRFDGDSLVPAVSRAEPGDRWGGLFPIFLR